MSKINTYEELLLEKERLELQLSVQKAVVKDHFEELKEKLNPVRNAISFFSNFTAPPKDNSIVGTGLNLSLELLIRNLFFSKSGWIMRWVAPVLLKNLSANVLVKNRKTIVKKIKSLFSHNHNHKD